MLAVIAIVVFSVYLVVLFCVQFCGFWILADFNSVDYVFICYTVVLFL